MNKNLIRKPSALIAQSTTNVSLTQRKIYNLFLHKALEELKQNPERDLREFRVKLKDIRLETGIGTTDYKRIKEDVEALAKTTVSYNLFNKSKNDYSDWVVYSLLSYAVKVDEAIEFSLPKPVIELIKNPDVFALLDKLIMKDLKKSKYSMILYELYEDYKGAQIPEMSLEELRLLFGIEDGKYPNFYDFEKRCIKPAVKEIEDKTGILLEYTKLPLNQRKTTHIKFKFYSGVELAKRNYFKNIKGD